MLQVDTSAATDDNCGLRRRAIKPPMPIDWRRVDDNSLTALDGDRITELRITLTPADATEEVPAEDTP